MQNGALKTMEREARERKENVYKTKPQRFTPTFLNNGGGFDWHFLEGVEKIIKLQAEKAEKGCKAKLR